MQRGQQHAAWQGDAAWQWDAALLPALQLTGVSLTPPPSISSHLTSLRDVPFISITVGCLETLLH